MTQQFGEKEIDVVLGCVLDKFKKKVIGRVCPDQKVCTITIVNESITVPEFSSWNRKDINPCVNDDDNNQNKIVIVMESPHKDEFNKNKPVGVASGKTGENIASKLKEVLIEIKDRTNISLNTSYDLHLLNAVQFQCSLGFPTDYFRDLMFLGLWFNGGEADFKLRIQGLNLNSNDIVINACTLGSHSEFGEIFDKNFTESNLKEFFNNQTISYKCVNGLKFLVDEVISSLKSTQNFTYQKMNHPCNWDRDISYR